MLPSTLRNLILSLSCLPQVYVCLLTWNYTARLPTSSVHCCISDTVHVVITGFPLASVCVIFFSSFFGDGRLFWRRSVLCVPSNCDTCQHVSFCCTRADSTSQSYVEKFEIKRRAEHVTKFHTHISSQCPFSRIPLFSEIKIQHSTCTKFVPHVSFCNTVWYEIQKGVGAGRHPV